MIVGGGCNCGPKALGAYGEQPPQKGGWLVLLAAVGLIFAAFKGKH